MFSYMESISPNEAEEVRKTIQELFKQTCILQTKYDPVTLIQRDNARYLSCMRHREFISAYLEVMGCELIHDPQEHLFRIAGEGIITEKLTLLQTRLLLLLKLIYRDKIMGEGLHATTTNLAEIRMYGKDTNLLKRKLTEQEWYEALSLLKPTRSLRYRGPSEMWRMRRRCMSTAQSTFSAPPWISGSCWSCTGMRRRSWAV